MSSETHYVSKLSYENDYVDFFLFLKKVFYYITKCFIFNLQNNQK